MSLFKRVPAGIPDGSIIIPYDFWGQPVFLAPDNKTLFCPGFTGPTFSTNQFDYLVIGGMQTPGIAEVKASKGRRFDEKPSAGADGARITMHGLTPAKLEIKLTIWTPDQKRELVSLWAKIFPGPQKIVTTRQEYVTGSGAQTRTLTTFGAGYGTPLGADANVGSVTTIPSAVIKTVTNTRVIAPVKPFSIQHPALNDIGVSNFIFHGGESWAPGTYPRSKVFTFQAIEYHPPGKATVTNSPVQPKGSAYDPKNLGTPGQNPHNTGPG